MIFAEVAERSNALDCKSSGLTPYAGSNPALCTILSKFLSKLLKNCTSSHLETQLSTIIHRCPNRCIIDGKL